MMHHFYQQNSPLMPIRRATEPVTLAPTASMIDPNLESHRIQHSQLSPRYGGMQMAAPMTMPNQGNGNLQARSHGNANMGNHSNGHTTPTFQHAHTGPPERGLPSKEANDLNIEDSYVQFIMYCNPSVPLDVDTAELRRGFRAPPKSDGKSFSPFTLYQLITRLESKDIKTWTELVIELGVSPPDVSKNQSTQKVQQYAVRLKRWLHAFHVDAFFKYLSNLPTTYTTERPTSNDTLVEREGIPPEEDLALRALLPEWRPKRGRRKAEDIEAETEASSTNKKLHTRSSSADFTSMFEEQYSAAPSSAMPWSAQPPQADPWAAAQVAIAPKTPNASQTPASSQLNPQSVGQQMRWRFTNNETTSSPYPQSAITPRHTFSASPAFDEPKSAHPSTTNTSKSPPRARRRHGPAVSSAWPSTTSTASGKLRGRPPSNRSIQDGPFSTFPANPNGKDGPNTAANPETQTQGSVTPSREATPSTQSGITFIQTPTLSNPGLPKKPSKLQLQVPEHAGGPVRLATPPRVLINGESNGRQGHERHERRSSADFFNQLDEGDEEIGMADEEDEDAGVDWKRRAMMLKRKLGEKEEELRAMKRRVLDAVM